MCVPQCNGSRIDVASSQKAGCWYQQCRTALSLGLNTNMGKETYFLARRDALRASIGHAGDDHRLGAQEAPPANISLGTGESLENTWGKSLLVARWNGWWCSLAVLNTVMTEGLSKLFTWCNKDGVNHCTENRNQHVPQYGESCSTHSSVFTLAEAIKLVRGAKGIDIIPSVHHAVTRRARATRAGFCPNGDWACTPCWTAASRGLCELSWDHGSLRWSMRPHVPKRTLCPRGVGV